MALRALLSLFLVLLAPAVHAELIFSAPPRENAAEAERFYAPLAALLGKIMGQAVVFEAPESWAAYSRNIQEGTYDFVLDGPHFVAWRMAHTGHTPLVRLDGDLGYTVLVQQDGPSTMEELRFQKVCSMASPNLAAVVLLAQFDPYAAPTVVAPRGGVKGAFEGFLEGRCPAVVLPSYFSARLPPEKTAGLRTVFTSAELPNLTLSAGPRVPAQIHADLIGILTNESSQAGLEKLLTRLAGTGTGKLVPARADDYKGHERLLEGLVWGW